MSSSPETICERCGGTNQVLAFTVEVRNNCIGHTYPMGYVMCLHCRAEMDGKPTLLREEPSMLIDIRRIVREELERSNP